nr:AraC family transcriptional regulator [uncultured Niameybacter sp.]
MGNNRYNFSAQESTLSKIRLLYVSESIFEEDWSSFLHTHQFVELFYILNGEGHFCIEGEKHFVKKDSVIIINPHVLHTEVSEPSFPLEYIAIGAEGISFNFESEGNPQNYGIYHYTKKQEDIYFCFKRLLYEVENKEKHFEHLCEHLIEMLAYYLMRSSKLLVGTSIDQNETVECHKVKRYIEKNCLKPLTLEDLAGVAHINKYYLVHSFTKIYGISPISYLIEKKIQVAKELLTTTDHSILEISQLIGCSSQSYFSQIFKKACGRPPAVYRKQAKTNGSN